MSKLIALAMAGVLMCAATPAAAFHNEGEFMRDGAVGGGGGLSFTGSRAANGFECSVCHIEPERRMYMTIASHPEGLTTEGRYVPGESYHLVIQMRDEHAGVGGNLNRNTFMMEILDDEDQAAGEYHHPGEAATEVVPDAILAGRGAVSNATEWDVMWTAPSDGRGLTIYLAGVDGDGGEGGRLAPDGDPWNDDVFAGSIRLLPVGAPPEPMSEGGCSAAGRSGRGGVMVWTLSLMMGLWIAIRRRWRRGALGIRALALGALTLGAVGCEDAGTVVDCTRMICAPDGGVSDYDAGPHHTETDAGPVFPDDDAGPDHDAGPHHVEHDGGMDHDGGAMCAGEAPMMEPGGVFCMDSCYCRSPERCLPVGGAEACCDDAPVCPTGGQRFAGCAPRMPIMVGDGTGCAHGQCYCGSDDRCYPMGTAPGCCAGEVRCF